MIPQLIQIFFLQLPVIFFNSIYQTFLSHWFHLLLHKTKHTFNIILQSRQKYLVPPSVFPPRACYLFFPIHIFKMLSRSLHFFLPPYHT